MRNSKKFKFFWDKGPLPLLYVHFPNQKNIDATSVQRLCKQFLMMKFIEIKNNKPK